MDLKPVADKRKVIAQKERQLDTRSSPGNVVIASQCRHE
jgi:hypothetical protein